MRVYLTAAPEFHALVGDEAAEELRCSVGDDVRTSRALKRCFSRMMSCEKKVFVDELNELVKRVTEEGERADHRNSQLTSFFFFKVSVF